MKVTLYLSPTLYYKLLDAVSIRSKPRHAQWKNEVNNNYFMKGA